MRVSASTTAAGGSGWRCPTRRRARAAVADGDGRRDAARIGRARIAEDRRTRRTRTTSAISAGSSSGCRAGWTARTTSRRGPAREFAQALGALTGLPVHLQDERLTSHEAEARLAARERDWRKRKAQLDAAAAAVILQDYLDARADAEAASASSSLLLLVGWRRGGAWWMTARFDDAVPRLRRARRSSSICRRASASRRLASGSADAGVVPIRGRSAWPRAWRASIASCRRASIASRSRRRRRGGRRGRARRRLHASDHVSRRPDDRRDGGDLRARADWARRPTSARRPRRRALVGDLDPDAETLEGYLFPRPTRCRVARAPTTPCTRWSRGSTSAFDATLRTDAAARS